MKFSALNVDFNGVSFEFSTWFKESSVRVHQIWLPPSKLLTSFPGYQHRWPRTPKIWGFQWNFRYFRQRRTPIVNFRRNYWRQTKTTCVRN